MDLDDPIWPQKCFTWKVAFFQKDQSGIGPIRRKSEENGQKWILEPLSSEIFKFGGLLDKRLRGRVVILFRLNFYCFWEIWAGPGSIPLSGT